VCLLCDQGAKTFLIAIVCAALAPLSAQDQNQTSPVSASESRPQGEVPIELFKAPHPKQIDVPDCKARTFRTPAACVQLRQGTEGWVELGFMVDPDGKPFEVTVVRSTGDRTFEKAATQAIEDSSFEPGSVDGKAVESGYEMKYVFENYQSLRAASPRFARAYEWILKEIDAGNQSAANAALRKLKISNLYEDAYFGVASYMYSSKWGTDEEELAGLRRAIAFEDRAHYLPADTFRSALFTCLQLEIKTREYAEAMTTWKSLQRSGMDPAALGRIRPVIEQVAKIRSDGSAYEVSGVMQDGRWYLHLFKRHFQVAVSTGFVSQVKLRCDKRYVAFAFDPKLQYQLQSKDGACLIELEGEPGTQLKLTQF
jgi:TonB family protein